MRCEAVRRIILVASSLTPVVVFQCFQTILHSRGLGLPILPYLTSPREIGGGLFLFLSVPPVSDRDQDQCPCQKPTERRKQKKKKSRCLSTGSQRETESCVSSTTDSGALERRGMTLLFRTFLISCVGQRTVARMSGQIPPNSVSVKVHTQIGPGTGHWRRN